MIHRIFRVLRAVLMAITKPSFGGVGEDFNFNPLSSRFRGKDKIFIGDRVFISIGADFSIHNKLHIGDDVMFGPQVMILSGNHPVENIGYTMNVFDKGLNGKCIIGNDVWIGARSVLIGELKIGEGAVIGAGSIVTKDIPPYTIAAGVPCKPIRRRFSDTELASHLERIGKLDTLNKIINDRNSYFQLKESLNKSG